MLFLPRRLAFCAGRGFAFLLFAGWLLILLAGGTQAQPFRFELRAEPDVIPANGISSTSIFVQAQNLTRGGISVQPIVRFATTAGFIEPQARLFNGSARVLLRSTSTPGTAIVTAFIGNSREQVSVEFSNDSQGLSRFWQIAGAPVSYGAEKNIISAAGPCTFDLGDTHIESDTRLDVDVQNQWLWAEGNSGRVLIRHGQGGRAHELRGDRLFYDIRRRRGVMRRGDAARGPVRQEFVGSDFSAPGGGIKSLGEDVAETAPETPQTQPIAEPKAPEPTVQPVSFAIRPATTENSSAKPPLRFVSSGGETAPIAAEDATSRLAVRPEKPKSNDGLPDDGDGPEVNKTPDALPAYKPLPEQEKTARYRVNEPSPPEYDNEKGYWVVSRWIRVFPSDKLQFGRATVFYNARKLFAMRLYMAPLNGNFNPATNMIGVNTSGGFSLKVPYYYQASPKGTGAVYLINSPKNGFSSNNPGLSLAVEHQYWMSNRAQGRLSVDEIGRGGWNLNWQHRMQFSPTTNGGLYFSMPRHRDAYLNGTIAKQFKTFDIGLEGYYSRPSAGDSNFQGAFYARMRPKEIGQSGWTYTVSANVNAVRRFYTLRPNGTQAKRGWPLYGQTASATLMGPTYKLWKGATLDSTLSGTAFNYSNGYKGASPGVTLGLQQFLGKNALVRLDYQYDKGVITPYNNGLVANGTNVLNASAQVNFGTKIYTNFLWSQSLSDSSSYGYTTLDYYFKPKWRAGVFADYSKFDDAAFMNYGISLGRMIGAREFSLNWDKYRGRFYVEFGDFFN
jgi:hypothetical protein